MLPWPAANSEPAKCFRAINGHSRFGSAAPRGRPGYRRLGWEPDVAVLRPRADDYTTATARPPDVLLLIEVADTSLDDDRAIKLPLYAENGIAECWIVNLIERVVEVCRQPRNDRFAEIRRVGPGEVLDVALVPGVALPFVELFPPIA